ncbi:MAG TPA: PHP domain-containing protein [Candidatus Obscuribacterales bacterium]
MPADLHLHTLHSDGSWTPTQVVEAACEQGLQCIAITDHDTVAGIAEAQRVAAARVEVIPGIEINTVYATANGERLDVHILGYFIDTDNADLRKTMQRQQDARHQLVADTIVRCNKLGIDLQMQHVIECAGTGSIGRPHLSRAIVKAGGAKDVTEAFSRFMSRESPDFIPRNSITPQEAIQAIESAGGIASIAHPGKNERMERVILELKEAGLRAVEAYHRSHSLELVKQYLRLAAINHMLATGGSDCHGPSDGYPASIGSVKVPIDVVLALKSAVPARTEAAI